MASETFVQPAIPRFDGHYDHWSMLMENFLRSKEYWTTVVSGVAEPATFVVLANAQKVVLKWAVCGLNYQAQFILLNQIQTVLGNRIQLGL